MNKVDELVAKMMLKYPHRYLTRFEAFCELMTNSGFAWNKKGEIVEDSPPQHSWLRDATPEKMLAECQATLDKRIREASTEPCLAALNAQFICAERKRLHDAQFIADNLEVWASSYCNVDYHQTWLWLLKTEKDEVCTWREIGPHWPVNNPPKNIDEEWRKAIYEFFRFLMPCVNGLFGAFDRKANCWHPANGHEEMFTWIAKSTLAYESEDERTNRKEFSKIIDDILEKTK